MKREIADLQTKFSVSGVDATKAGFKDIAGAAKATAKATADAAQNTAQLQAASALAASKVAADVAKAQALIAKATLTARSPGALKSPEAIRAAAARAQADLARARATMDAARLRATKLDPNSAGARMVGAQLAMAGSQLAQGEKAATVDAVGRAAKRQSDLAAAHKRTGDEARKSASVSFDRQASSLRRVAKAARSAGKAMARLARFARRYVVRIAVAYKAAEFGVTAFGVRSANQAYERSRETEDQATAAGMELTRFSGLAYGARMAGVDGGTLSSSLATAQQKLTEALVSPDSLTAQYLRQLNISLTDANGQLRATDAVLDQIARKTVNMRADQRMAIFSEILGPQGARVAKMFQQLQAEKDRLLDSFPVNGKYAEVYGEAMSSFDLQSMSSAEMLARRQAHFGSLVTPQDVGLMNQFKAAVETVKEAWSGVGMTVARRVTPALTIVARWAAESLRQYRFLIAEVVANSIGRKIRLLSDAIDVFFKGIRRPQFGNNWLAWVADGLKLAGVALRATMKFASELWLQLNGRGAEGTWPWVGTLVDGLKAIGNGIVWVAAQAQVLAREIGYAWAGDTWKIEEFPFLKTVRTGLLEARQYIRDFVGDAQAAWSGVGASSGRFPWIQTLVTQLQAAKVWIAGLWNDVLSIFSGGSAFSSQGQAIAQAIQTAGSSVAWFKDQIQAAWTMADGFYRDLLKGWSDVSAIMGGGQATNFTGLNESLKPWIDSLKEAWAWVSKVYGAVDQFFKAITFGNLGARDVGLLLLVSRLTGLTGLLGAALMLVKGPLSIFRGLLSAVSKLMIAGGLAKTGGLIGAISTLGTAATKASPGIAGMTTAFGAAAGAAGGLNGTLSSTLGLLGQLGTYGLLAAGGAAAGYGLYQLAQGTGIQKASDGLMGWIYGTQGKVDEAARIAREYNDSHRTGAGNAVAQAVSRGVDWSQFGQPTSNYFAPQTAPFPAAPAIARSTIPGDAGYVDDRRTIQIRPDGDPDKVINIFTDTAGLKATTEGLNRSFATAVWERG